MPIHRRILLYLLLPLAISSMAQTSDLHALIAQGDSLLEAGQGAKAMAKYNAAVAMGPSADALAARARGWFFQNRMPQFLADVNASLALDSLQPQANYQRALYASRTEDHAATIRFSTRALQGQGKPGLRRQTLLLRGEAEAATNLNEQAIADLREGIDNRLDEPAAMKLLARLLDEAGKPEASLEVLEKLCAVHPADIGNWSNKGFELNRLERYEEAVQALDQALAIDKDEPVVLSNKAYALLKLDRDADALATVNKSLKGDPVNAYALRTRAMLYLRKGEREKACNDLSLSKAMGSVPEVDALIKQHCEGMQPKR